MQLRRITRQSQQIGGFGGLLQHRLRHSPDAMVTPCTATVTGQSATASRITPAPARLLHPPGPGTLWTWGDDSALPSDYNRTRPAGAVTSFLTAARAEHETMHQDSRRLRLFSGTSNPHLAREIADYLGVPDGPRVCKRFADGELYVQIQESIRGCDVFLIQPTCAPVNDHLMELLIMVDACRRASARQITAVVPYYGYARADRKTAGRESITAKLTANLLVQSGVDRVLAMDLHSAQIQGYFDIPCDHIYGSPVLVDYLSTQNLGDIVVVSPDVGGVARARAFAKQMNDAPLAIIDKRRTGHNMAESLTVIGDVAGKTARC